MGVMCMASAAGVGPKPEPIRSAAAGGPAIKPTGQKSIDAIATGTSGLHAQSQPSKIPKDELVKLESKLHQLAQGGAKSWVKNLTGTSYEMQKAEIFNKDLLKHKGVTSKELEEDLKASKESRKQKLVSLAQKNEKFIFMLAQTETLFLDKARGDLKKLTQLRDSVTQLQGL